MLSRDRIALAPSLMSRSEDGPYAVTIVNCLDSQLANIDIRVKLKRCEYTGAVMKVAWAHNSMATGSDQLSFPRSHQCLATADQ